MSQGKPVCASVLKTSYFQFSFFSKYNQEEWWIYQPGRIHKILRFTVLKLLEFPETSKRSVRPKPLFTTAPNPSSFSVSMPAQTADACKSTEATAGKPNGTLAHTTTTTTVTPNMCTASNSWLPSTPLKQNKNLASFTWDCAWWWKLTKSQLWGPESWLSR